MTLHDVVALGQKLEQYEKRVTPVLAVLLHMKEGLGYTKDFLEQAGAAQDRCAHWKPTIAPFDEFFMEAQEIIADLLRSCEISE